MIFAICLVTLILQLWTITYLPLFGDEAFYWLEGQNLAWSYAELPGWTAWMIRLGTELFDNNYFGVRFFSFLAFISLFWVIWLINQALEIKNSSTNLLWLLSVPIVVIVATMALPDIWLLFFVMWSSYYFIKATKGNEVNTKIYWLLLGVFCALSINVHIRMWIWLFIAGIAFIGVFYKEKYIIKPALLITLPITLLGLLPILFFNVQHDFPLLHFQLSQRHPWQFQVSNINFLLSQILVATPLVLLVWFKKAIKLGENKVINWILVTALVHWIFYVLMSFFVDGLRTNVHWLIISYMPVLAIVKPSKLKNWALITASIATVIFLVFLSLNRQVNSNLQARILDNSVGWEQLALEVQEIKQQQNIDNIVADYFMTAAELAFEMDNLNSIKVLKHAKNIKHGRQKQLDIMGLLLENPITYTKPALLIVENSTLKLQEKGQYYQKLCNNFKQIKFLRSITINNTNKQYHVFKINASDDNCEIPPLFYIDHKVENNTVNITGWVIFHGVGVQSLTLISGDKAIDIKTTRIKNTGIATQFPEIKDPNSPHNGFEIQLPLSILKEKNLQIKVLGNNGDEYFSPLYFLN